MRITYYLAIGFFLAIVACIMYLKYSVHYSGVIAYILIVIFGGIGILLTLTSVKQFQQDKKKWSLFQNTEGVFVSSTKVTNNKFISYEYLYEYYVSEKRYEYTDIFMHWSKGPEESDEKMTIRYNPENPKEIRTIDKEYIISMLNGPICIVFALLLLFILLIKK